MNNELNALWLKAESGDLDAWCELGIAYANKESDAYDPARAVECYRHAADRGQMYAMNNLGVHVLNGEGVPQDQPAAFELIQGSARQGNAQAMFNLGALYEQGLGTDADLMLALAWMERAHAAGHEDASCATLPSVSRSWLYC